MRLTVIVAVMFASLCATGAIAQTAAEQAACRSDFAKLCKGTKPGGGRILTCLAEHKDKLSPACLQVIEAHGQ
jgi:hypothetical protein